MQLFGSLHTKKITSNATPKPTKNNIHSQLSPQELDKNFIMKNWSRKPQELNMIINILNLIDEIRKRTDDWLVRKQVQHYGSLHTSKN